MKHFDETDYDALYDGGLVQRFAMTPIGSSFRDLTGRLTSGSECTWSLGLICNSTDQVSTVQLRHLYLQRYNPAAVGLFVNKSGAYIVRFGIE